MLADNGEKVEANVAARTMKSFWRWLKTVYGVPNNSGVSSLASSTTSPPSLAAILAKWLSDLSSVSGAL